MGDPSNVLVVCMGTGTVFVGLICIIIISSIMSAIVRGFEKNKPAPAPKAAAPAAAPAQISNKQEIVAAVCAVIAEELGADVSDIRIHSFKKVN